MKINKLNIKQVENAKATLGDGGGLYLKVDKLGHRKWVFRYSLNGKVNEMGLGGSLVSLAVARKLAVDARENVALGINPATARREKHAVAPPPKPAFGKIAGDVIAKKSKESRNAKHREQWRQTLETYCKPIWATPVDLVDTQAVLGVLQPVWQAIPETASRLRGRIESVLDAARALGHIPADRANPARWKGHLDHLLPKRKVSEREHHAGMPYGHVPAFMATLRNKETMPSLALQFLILTAARAGEVLGARWSEIDLEAEVWTIPAARMKGARAHRVPLSGPAMVIVERMAEIRTCDFVFAGRRGGSLSSGAYRSIVPTGSTAHGFRSSFRDWVGNETNFPREIAEGALAHATGGAVELAYRRSDALEKRRDLMEAWANFCEPEAVNNVTGLFQPRVA